MGGIMQFCNRIGYLISESSGTADRINHNFVRVRIGSYNSLPIEKAYCHNTH